MNIVVGYIDTPEGDAALETGLAEAKLRGARLHVLHFVRVGVRNESAEVIVRYRAQMAAIAERLEREGVDGRSLVLMGSRERGEALLAEVRKLEPEMLILGSRQRTRVGKLMLGSTVQYLLLRAECAVMLVGGRRG